MTTSRMLPLTKRFSFPFPQIRPRQFQTYAHRIPLSVLEPMLDVLSRSFNRGRCDLAPLGSPSLNQVNCSHHLVSQSHLNGLALNDSPAIENDQRVRLNTNSRGMTRG